MRKTLLCSALFGVSYCAAVAQVIQLDPHPGAKDLWGNAYDSRTKMTFSGQVTGIEIARQNPSSEDQVAILVKDKTTGRTAIVELGPKWFVDGQEARVHTYDRVQVTGSKMAAGNRNVIVASMVRVGDQGGPVLALRKPSGKAYWADTEIAQNPPAGDSSAVITSPDSQVIPTVVNPPLYPDNVIQSNNGLVNIDLGPVWYSPTNMVYQVGRFMNIVSGPYPFTLGPF